MKFDIWFLDLNAVRTFKAFPKKNTIEEMIKVSLSFPYIILYSVLFQFFEEKEVLKCTRVSFRID